MTFQIRQRWEISFELQSRRLQAHFGQPTIRLVHLVTTWQWMLGWMWKWLASIFARSAWFAEVFTLLLHDNSADWNIEQTLGYKNSTHCRHHCWLSAISKYVSGQISFFSTHSGSIGDATVDEFQGQFFVKKLPRLNTLVCHIPETYNYVFRLGRRKLHIEIPHLGPETTREPKKKKGDNKPASKSTSGNVSRLLCIPGPPSKVNPLDF